MWMIPPSVRIFLATEPSDMRRSFDTLAGNVRDFLRRDPLAGHLFVFRNRRGDRVKILYWDRTGYCLWYKRLEVGVFHFPKTEGASSVEVNAPDMALMLEGIELAGAKRRKRFTLEGREAAGVESGKK